ncbi:uncharacterized protein LOC134532658 [Bacillus rossius redtenbacheri]|uniref:uncharacterized protein LOC134532658 n=1 Tax=Bacillus rossius redtenbacheri TaxID=93214 RepID=UPI002FDD5E9D
MQLYVALLCVSVVAAVEHRATVDLADPQGQTGVRGHVTLVQQDEGEVLVSGEVSGLSPGLHGFHVHLSPDIAGGCAGAQGHYNPHNKHHGGPLDADRHIGDLGNIEAGQDGVARVHVVDGHIRLTGPHSVVGRSVVVHSDEDDLGKGGFSDSLTTGHAGSRLACGVIVQ